MSVWKPLEYFLQVVKLFLEHAATDDIIHVYQVDVISYAPQDGLH